MKICDGKSICDIIYLYLNKCEVFQWKNLKENLGKLENIWMLQVTYQFVWQIHCHMKIIEVMLSETPREI